MNEGTSSAWLRGLRGRISGSNSGKDRARSLLIIPPLAQDLLFRVAEEAAHLGLLRLLVQHYLRPDQAVGARLSDEGLVVKGFERPLLVDPAERPVLAEWLGRTRRPHSAAAVRNLLAGDLRRRLVAALAAYEAATNEDTTWRVHIDIGVRSLRRLARELLADAADYDEAVYRELLHDETADPNDTLHWLTARARQVLADAAKHEAVRVALLQGTKASP